MGAILRNTTALDTAASPRPNLRLVHSERGPLLAAAKSNDHAVVAYLAPGKHGNETLLRKAMNAANELDGEFYAVYVNTPRIVGGLRNPRILIDDLVLAGVLGAKIVWLESRDPASALLGFARKSGVERIFVARSEPSIFQHSIYRQLLDRGDGFQIDVVGFERATADHRN